MFGDDGSEQSRQSATQLRAHIHEPRSGTSSGTGNIGGDGPVATLSEVQSASAAGEHEASDAWRWPLVNR